MKKIIGASIKNLMVIDDNDIDCFIALKVLQLENIGENYLCVRTVKKAINTLETMAEKDLPEIIFLDINLPVLNGYGFLSHFEELPERIKTNIKIVVLSSSDHSRDMMLMETNPRVLAFLQKPLNKTELKKVFELDSPELKLVV